MDLKKNEGLIKDFLFTFARFEQAMKSTGYHKGDGDARACWDKLANVPTVKREFDDPQPGAFFDAVVYIEKESPQKQVVKDNILTWKPASAGQDTRAKNVFVYVRRVRNNLFHGGKFEDSFRLNHNDKCLLESSLTIMRRCLDVDERLRKQYEFIESAA